MDVYLVPALDGVGYGLLLFVVGAGLTLCFGVADILNLAHGTLYALGAYLAATLGDGTWAAMLLAVAAAGVAAATAGTVVAGLVTPVVRRGHLAQALLTFGLALIGGDLLTWAFGAREVPVRLPAAVDRPVTVAGHTYPGYRLVFILVAAAMAVGLWLVVTRTGVGAVVRAAVDDQEMLACLGVDPLRVRIGVLAGAGALAGLAGALGAPIIGPGPGTAGTVLLLSLVVVVLGGLGSIGGALLAAVAVGEVQTLGVALAPSAAPFLLSAAMAAVLALRARRSGAGRTR